MPMVKISELNFDKKFQFMPGLSEKEYLALKEDIRVWGIQNPPEVDEEYRPLDGWNRIRACQELGLSEIPVVIRDTGMSEEMKIEHTIILNMDRRQITKIQKEDVVSKVIDMFPDYSFVRLAKITGLSDKTVKKIAERKCPVSECSETGQHEGADGKIYESSKKALKTQRENIRQMIQNDPDKSDRQIARETGASPTTVGSQRKAVNSIGISRYTQEDIDKVTAELEGFSDDPFGANAKENAEKTPSFTAWAKDHPEEVNLSEFNKMSVTSSENFEEFRNTVETAVRELNEILKSTDFEDEVFFEKEKHKIIENLISDLFDVTSDLRKEIEIK